MAYEQGICGWTPVRFMLSLSPLRPSDVEQMAIDWLTKNFYFVDDVDDRVFVCNKDGQTCVTLLDQDLYNPKGIALDPTMGLVAPPAFLDLELPVRSSLCEGCLMIQIGMLTKLKCFLQIETQKDADVTHAHACLQF